MKWLLIVTWVLAGQPGMTVETTANRDECRTAGRESVSELVRLAGGAVYKADYRCKVLRRMSPHE